MCCFLCVHLVPVDPGLLDTHPIYGFQKLVVCSSNPSVSQQACCLQLEEYLHTSNRPHPSYCQVSAIHQWARSENHYGVQFSQRTETCTHLEIGMLPRAITWQCGSALSSVLLAIDSGLMYADSSLLSYQTSQDSWSGQQLQVSMRYTGTVVASSTLTVNAPFWPF